MFGPLNHAEFWPHLGEFCIALMVATAAFGLIMSAVGSAQKKGRFVLTAERCLYLCAALTSIAVLILVISVMTGFQRELQRKVIGFEPHLVVSNNGILDGWQGLAKKISGVPEVTSVAPFVQGPVIVKFQHQSLGQVDFAIL